MIQIQIRRPALATAFALAAILSPAAAGEPGPTKLASPIRHDLTPESSPKLLALVRPKDSEWRHLRVRWLTDVVAARKAAARDDKPMVVLYTGGAGYNEPLGVC